MFRLKKNKKLQINSMTQNFESSEDKNSLKNKTKKQKKTSRYGRSGNT